jgi:hypothetical protein
MRTTFITFLECEIEGNWSTMTPNGGGSGHYIAKEDNAIVRLVREDGLKRNFAFRKNATIYITPMMLRFESDDMIEELTVDEDERAGRQPQSKLKIT